ncbi:MAG: DUF3501 family protein [Halioglobus sp.]
MAQLTRADLWSLEEYAQRRATFRASVMAHKKARQCSLGDHLRLHFEDALTVRYQIQEMLRIEKIFEAAAIQEELDAYNPLIPDGSNWKATLMIEYADPGERARQLARMHGIEDTVWLQVQDCDRLYPIADEDLERSNAQKTSSVHFLRYELSPMMISAAQAGAGISAGVDHPSYPTGPLRLPEPVRASLVDDLAAVAIN